MNKPTKKAAQEAETAYYVSKERYGENNMATQRAWSKWQELKNSR